MNNPKRDTAPDIAPDTGLDPLPEARPNAVLGSRREQMFPVLRPEDINQLRRFGIVKHFTAGDALFVAAQSGVGMFVLLSGRVGVTQRDGFGARQAVIEQGPGQFIAEVSSMSGAPVLVDAVALDDVEAIVVPPANLRSVVIAEADLGERIIRALILRRVGLLLTGHGGPLLIGPRDAPDMARLGNFLRRNGHPHKIVDPADGDPEALARLAEAHAGPRDLPLVITPSGVVMSNPTVPELARALGLIGSAPGRAMFDVAIVGAGPAGLAAAVYAASEGLSVAVIDGQGYGGQAGESARIENYFGFPTGITGRALTARAQVQAVKFGAEMIMPTAVERMDCLGASGPYRLRLEVGGPVNARTVVIASGARYRRPSIPGIEEFEGRGVSYWASPIEARICRGAEVALVGGGNSAGQAAVYLSQNAVKVWMMVRRGGLEATMSRYLIERIEAAPNITLLTETEVTALGGDPEEHLESITWTNRRTGASVTRDIRNLFLFVGAVPATDWLGGCALDLDKAGFVLTGAAVPGAAPDKPALEASRRGVFAIGDARAGSVKRVGGAIGEGAAVVAQIHVALAQLAEAEAAALSATA